jgi:uncharacterized SAM-binding protein YcdF (DUF218 family)
MNTSWIITNAVSTFLLPPLSLILLCGLGLMMQNRRPRLGRRLSALALLLLAFLSTGVGASLLVRPLEDLAPPLTSTRNLPADAIVVLGGGRLANAPEYGNQDVPNLTTPGRLRYAAVLQRATGLPLLVTGGAPDGAPQAEAVLMAQVLRDEFAVPVRWIEQASDNTAQNAQFSAQLLQPAGVRRIVLVTDALHMARARQVFEYYGLQVLAAPTVFYGYPRPSPLRWLPSAGALRLSHYALHEWLGLAWYRLRQKL